jgi:hypothetical protein
MKKVASRWEISPARCNAALLVLFVTCPAWAQEAGQPTTVARNDVPVRMEVQASALPRLEAQDGGFQAPRVDVSLFPANAGGMGAVFGMSGFAIKQPMPVGLAPNRPSVDVGVRFTHKLQSLNQIDVTAWRRMNTPDDAYTLIQVREPVYGARVEMNIKPSSVIAFDRSSIGLQLEGGGRISIKRKNGGPMVYYKTAF